MTNQTLEFLKDLEIILKKHKGYLRCCRDEIYAGCGPDAEVCINAPDYRDEYDDTLKKVGFPANRTNWLSRIINTNIN